MTKIDWKRLSRDILNATPKPKRNSGLVHSVLAAEAVGISKSTYYRMADGESCRAETFIHICLYLDKNPLDYVIIKEQEDEVYSTLL